METLHTGDVVRVMTEAELQSRVEGADWDPRVDGLRWVRAVMDTVLGKEVTVRDIVMGDHAYSSHKSNPGYYEFSIEELPPGYHLNPSMLHAGALEIPDIDEVDWSTVAFC